MPETNSLNLTRRGFLKTTGIVAGSTAIAGAVPTMQGLAYADGDTSASEEITQFNHACRGNCSQSCMLTVNVCDGKIISYEPAELPDDEYTGGCLRGLSYIARTYSRTRIKYPMRRVEGSERGAGEWERVSWDDAYQEIVTKLKAVTDKYGSNAIMLEQSSGNFGGVMGAPTGIWMRLGWAAGWSTVNLSQDAGVGHGIKRVFGTTNFQYSNEPRALLDSRLIICWGTNPVSTAPFVWRFIRKAQESGCKVITIDPIKSQTAHRSDEYIPIIPGQDGYVALAMANYLIEKDLIDHKYIDNLTTAAFLVRSDTGLYLRKSDYVELAEGDKDEFYVWDEALGGKALIAEASKPAKEGTFPIDDVKVTTAFSLLKKRLSEYSLSKAAELSGISEDKIIELAERIATTGPVTINITYGIDHYMNGHLTTHAIAILMALTGNYGKEGAGFTGQHNPPEFGFNFLAFWMSDGFKGVKYLCPSAMLWQTIADQKLGDTQTNVKAMITYASNSISNFADQKYFIETALPQLDFWVVVDSELTDTAQYADLILPCCLWSEEEEIRNGNNHPFLMYQEKAIDPLYESKSDLDIVCELGRLMGFEKTFPKDWTFDNYAELLLSSESVVNKGITLEHLKKEKVLRQGSSPNRGYVWGLDKPLATESHRAELYWEKPTSEAKYTGQDLSDLEEQRLPYYREPGEASKNNPLYQKYPLVYLQEHQRYRTHSQWWEVPLLREIDPEPLARFNGIEADKRGLKTGDIVEVYNDRGHAVCKCHVDESVAPGVLVIPKGWQRSQFIAGCYQELTNREMDPWATAFVYFDTLVDVRKWEEE